MPILPAINSGTKGAVVPIAYQSLSSNGYVIFTNVPTIYQDLMLVVNARAATTTGDSGTTNQCYVNTYFNNITTGYSVTFLIGDGASATSPRATSQVNAYLGYIPNSTAGTGIFGSAVAHILNYANTSTYKTVLSRTAGDANGSGRLTESVNLWQNTAAINNLTVYCSSSNFTAGSTVALYGIRSVNQ